MHESPLSRAGALELSRADFEAGRWASHIAEADRRARHRRQGKGKDMGSNGSSVSGPKDGSPKEEEEEEEASEVIRREVEKFVKEWYDAVPVV